MPPAAPSAPPSDTWMRVGVVLVAVGVVASVVTLIPFLVGSDPLPLAAYLLALLAPVGLAVVLGALWRRARGRRRRLDAVPPSRSGPAPRPDTEQSSHHAR